MPAQSHHPLPADFAEAFANAGSRLGPFARSVEFYDSVGSTNDIAIALAGNGSAEGAVVIADAQTAGRGRRGRTWHSPPASGLYVSVVLSPGSAARDPARAISMVTLAAGVALAEGVSASTGLRADIKWPNDLVVGRRKLAGILAEGVSPRSGGGERLHDVVLGFGINVSPAAFPSDLADRVTSIESELGRPIDRGLVCAESLVALASRYDDLMTGRFDAILDAWTRCAPGSHGAYVRWHDFTGQHVGVTAGIDAHGALLVRTGDALQRLVAGEVLWD